MKESRVAWHQWIILILIILAIFSFVFFHSDKDTKKTRHFPPSDTTQTVTPPNSDDTSSPAEYTEDNPKTSIYYDGAYHYIIQTPNNYVFRAEIPGTDGGPNKSPTVCYITENKQWSNSNASIYCIPAN